MANTACSQILPVRNGRGEWRCGKCRLSHLICVRPDASKMPQSWVCACCTNLRDNGCNLSPEKLEQFREVRRRTIRSLFNVGANRIVRHMAALRREIDEFIREHPSRCQCDFCQVDPDVAFDFLHDIRGLRWVLEVGHGCASSSIVLDAENLHSH
jgi:hypothetical protein